MKTTGAKRLSERYVRALFDVAQEADELDRIEKDFARLQDVLDESGELRHFLANPLLTREQQAETMQAVLAKIKAHKLTQRFLAVLAEHKRLPILPEVIALFNEWLMHTRGEVRGELIAPTKLKPLEVTLVSERLSKAYGKKVILDVRQDPSLLGGVVVKIGSQELDGSLSGKMRRLKLALQAA